MGAWTIGSNGDYDHHWSLKFLWRLHPWLVSPHRIGEAWLRPQWPTFITIVSTNFLSYNYVFLVSFCSWYQTCCFRSIMLYVYMWRVRFNGWKCAIVWLRVLVPPLNPFPYAPTLAQDETQLYLIITIAIKTTHSWLLWDYLRLFVGCFGGGDSSMDFG